MLFKASLHSRAELKDELSEIKKDIKSLRNEIKGGMKALEKDMRVRFLTLEKALNKVTKEIKYLNGRDSNSTSFGSILSLSF